MFLAAFLPYRWDQVQAEKSLSLKTRKILNVWLEVQTQVQIPHTISTDAASKANLQTCH